MVCGDDACSRSKPVAVGTNATGIDATNGLPAASTMLPAKMPLRAGVLPSLKMITPEAPAAVAFLTFAPKLHVPRWISAMLPAVNPEKSEGAQPLCEPPVDGSLMLPAAWTGALAVPWLAPGFHSSTILKDCPVVV